MTPNHFFRQRYRSTSTRGSRKTRFSSKPTRGEFSKKIPLFPVQNRTPGYPKLQDQRQTALVSSGRVPQQPHNLLSSSLELPQTPLSTHQPLSKQGPSHVSDAKQTITYLHNPPHTPSRNALLPTPFPIYRRLAHQTTRPNPHVSPCPPRILSAFALSRVSVCHTAPRPTPETIPEPQNRPQPKPQESSQKLRHFFLDHPHHQTPQKEKEIQNSLP